MSGIDFLADTNFLIYVNQGNPIVKPFVSYNYAISFITEIELKGAFNISKTQKEQFINMINDCFIIEMDYKIRTKCIDIRNRYKLKIPDAIISSSAIIYNLPLVTSDKEFKKVKELDLIFIDKD